MAASAYLAMNKPKRITPLAVGLLALLCGTGLWPNIAEADCDWPEWQQFKQAYISEQGRVIDVSDARKITTSEGQSYGLFFALVANDQATFGRLVDWTENNLAEGDLTARLPAWLWGENEQQVWMVLDSNSASDSDLWLAYDLLEAGRLWNNRRYQLLGTLLLQRIAREEVVDIPGLGVMLLPGKVGFIHKGDSEAQHSWTLNPSYLPPQLLARFTRLHGPWQEMQTSYQRLLEGAAPQGLVPDWIVWHNTNGWQPVSKAETKTGEQTEEPANENADYDGSYDAIRNYLWLGMLANDAPNREALLTLVQPMADLTTKQGLPPEHINSRTGQSRGAGPLGFSAALLPLLAQTEQTGELTQALRLTAAKFDEQAYYDSVLRLFGEGWHQGRYRFNAQGELQLREQACQK